jgi:hypothetical protein
MTGWAFTAGFQNEGFHKFAHGTDKLFGVVLHDEVSAIPDNDSGLISQLRLGIK